jgi:hypothetical protein
MAVPSALVVLIIAVLLVGHLVQRRRVADPSVATGLRRTMPLPVRGSLERVTGGGTAWPTIAVADTPTGSTFDEAITYVPSGWSGDQRRHPRATSTVSSSPDRPRPPSERRHHPPRATTMTAPGMKAPGPEPEPGWRGPTQSTGPMVALGILDEGT